jgi:CxxC-x17-CxxC domain-containing protein
MGAPLERSCIGCGDGFLIAPGERSFFDRKGLPLPKRCQGCRDARRPPPDDPALSEPDPRDVLCSACGALTRLKFEPSSDRPVYCDACFRNR